jgi:hypothetical protein
MSKSWFREEDQPGIQQYVEEHFDLGQVVFKPLHESGLEREGINKRTSKMITSNLKSKKKSPNLVHLGVIANSGMVWMKQSDIEKYCSSGTVEDMGLMSFQCKKEVLANGVLVGFLCMLEYEKSTDPILAAGHYSNMDQVDPAVAGKLLKLADYNTEFNQRLTTGLGHHIPSGTQFGLIKGQLSKADATAHGLASVLRCCSGAAMMSDPKRYTGAMMPTTEDIMGCEELAKWVENVVADKPADKWAKIIDKLYVRTEKFGSLDGVYRRKPRANGAGHGATIDAELSVSTSPPAGTPPRTATPAKDGEGMDSVEKSIIDLDDSVDSNDSYVGTPPHKRQSPQCESSPSKQAAGRLVGVDGLGESVVVREPYTEVMQNSTAVEGVLLIFTSPTNGLVSEKEYKVSASEAFTPVPSYEGDPLQMHMYLMLPDYPIELVVDVAGQGDLDPAALKEYVTAQAVKFVREQMMPTDGRVDSSNSMVHDVTVSIECPKGANSPWIVVVAVVLSKTDDLRAVAWQLGAGDVVTRRKYTDTICCGDGVLTDSGPAVNAAYSAYDESFGNNAFREDTFGRATDVLDNNGPTMYLLRENVGILTRADNGDVTTARRRWAQSCKRSTGGTAKGAPCMICSPLRCSSTRATGWSIQERWEMAR